MCGAGPNSAHCCVGVQAPIHCHTGGMLCNVYFFGCLIDGAPVVIGLIIIHKVLDLANNGIDAVVLDGNDDGATNFP